jgi:hypothetical protein
MNQDKILKTGAKYHITMCFAPNVLLKDCEYKGLKDDRFMVFLVPEQTFDSIKIHSTILALHKDQLACVEDVNGTSGLNTILRIQELYSS